MIDINNRALLNLTQSVAFSDKIKPYLLPEESVLDALHNGEQGVVLTGYRAFLLSTHGGGEELPTSVNVTVLPYHQVSAYALESNDGFKEHAVLELHSQALGLLKLQCQGKHNLPRVIKAIAQQHLK